MTDDPHTDRSRTDQSSAHGAAPLQRWSAATRVVSNGRPARAPDAPLNPPIILTSTYSAGGPLAYGREGNATWAALEEAIADLEQAPGAVAFGSGLAAISAVLDLLPHGSTVLAPTHPYSGTRARMRELTAHGRITVREYSAGPTADLTGLLDDVALVWIETPTNPLLEISDVEELARQAHTVGALVAVDATFVTPLTLQPLVLGADLVVHSATKYLSGHSDVLMGLVAAADSGVLEQVRQRRTLLGSVPGPFEAWLTLRGIRTLAVRLTAATANAQVLADRLLTRSDVVEVLYPGLTHHLGHELAMTTSGPGAIVSFVLDDAERAERVCGTTRLWTHGTSLGGVESLIERRGRWPAEHPDIPAGLIRLSVGIEDVEDLWSDLAQALDG